MEPDAVRAKRVLEQIESLQDRVASGDQDALREAVSLLLAEKADELREALREAFAWG